MIHASKTGCHGNTLETLSFMNVPLYFEFIKPGASIDSRHLGQDKRNILNILLSCPKMPRLHARSRLYEFGVYATENSLSSLEWFKFGVATLTSCHLNR